MAGSRQGAGIPEALTLIDTDTRTLADMLSGSGMFGDLSPNEIDVLGRHMRVYRAAKDDVVFVEGAHGGVMGIVIEGRLRVFKDSGRGSSKALAEVPAGKSLGEMSVIDGLPYSATVVAAEPVTLVTLTRADLDQITAKHPALAAKLLWRVAQLMSQRLRETSGMLVDFIGKV